MNGWWKSSSSLLLVLIPYLQRPRSLLHIMHIFLLPLRSPSTISLHLLPTPSSPPQILFISLNSRTPNSPLHQTPRCRRASLPKTEEFRRAHGLLCSLRRCNPTIQKRELVIAFTMLISERSRELNYGRRHIFRQMIEEISDEPSKSSHCTNRQRYSIYQSLYRDRPSSLSDPSFPFSHPSRLFYRLHILMTTSCQIIIVSSLVDSTRLRSSIILHYMYMWLLLV